MGDFTCSKILGIRWLHFTPLERLYRNQMLLSIGHGTPGWELFSDTCGIMVNNVTGI